MSEQTIYPEVLARVALKDSRCMVTVLTEIFRSHTTQDPEHVGEVLGAFAAEVTGAFREATALIAELESVRDELMELLVAAQKEAPLKRRSSRKGK